MRKILTSLALTGAALAVAPAHAEHGETVLGAAIGAVGGAYIGHYSGGRDGAIIGGALGGAIGAAIGNDYGRDEARYVYERRYYDRPRYRERYYDRPLYVEQRIIIIRDYCYDGWRGHRYRHPGYAHGYWNGHHSDRWDVWHRGRHNQRWN